MGTSVEVLKAEDHVNHPCLDSSKFKFYGTCDDKMFSYQLTIFGVMLPKLLKSPPLQRPSSSRQVDASDATTFQSPSILLTD